MITCTIQLVPADAADGTPLLVEVTTLHLYSVPRARIVTNCWTLDELMAQLNVALAVHALRQVDPMAAAMSALQAGRDTLWAVVSMGHGFRPPSRDTASPYGQTPGVNVVGMPPSAETVMAQFSQVGSPGVTDPARTRANYPRTRWATVASRRNLLTRLRGASFRVNRNTPAGPNQD